jgi:hypothetical protein
VAFTFFLATYETKNQKKGKETKKECSHGKCVLSWTASVNKGLTKCRWWGKPFSQGATSETVQLAAGWPSVACEKQMLPLHGTMGPANRDWGMDDDKTAEPLLVLEER